MSKLCSVMGVDVPYDPDPTYELTTDNVKKILAIYMRFRYVNNLCNSNLKSLSCLFNSKVFIICSNLIQKYCFQEDISVVCVFKELILCQSSFLDVTSQ